MKGNAIIISTKTIFLEVLRATIRYFAPYLARSKRCGHNTKISVKIAVPHINVHNIRKIIWPADQEHCDTTRMGVSSLKHVFCLTRLFKPNTSHTSDNPLRRDKLQLGRSTIARNTALARRRAKQPEVGTDLPWRLAAHRWLHCIFGHSQHFEVISSPHYISIAIIETPECQHCIVWQWAAFWARGNGKFPNIKQRKFDLNLSCE